MSVKLGPCVLEDGQDRGASQKLQKREGSSLTVTSLPPGHTSVNKTAISQNYSDPFLRRSFSLLHDVCRQILKHRMSLSMPICELKGEKKESRLDFIGCCKGALYLPHTLTDIVALRLRTRSRSSDSQIW